MLVPGPWVDWDCIVKILKGQGVEVIDHPAWSEYAIAVPRGDRLWAWPIRKGQRLAGAEVESVFQTFGLRMEDLEALQAKFCSDDPPANPAPLN